MIEDLLSDLAASGWKLSWAFQFSPNHWRVTITRDDYWNGCDQPAYHYSDCADAPSFAEALEDAMAKRNEAIFVESSPTVCSNEPGHLDSNPQFDLVTAMGLHTKPAKPFPRRI